LRAAGRKEKPGVTDQPDDLLTIEEVIATLRVSRAAFYRWRRQGTGPPAARLPGGAVRIQRSALQQWLHDLHDNQEDEDSAA
jgi:excisionase family DNA binding protein